ncbi:MAG: response regulator transcription factor [Granulosicoccus sp.]
MKQSILIVDDDDSVRRNYKDILEDEGYQVAEHDSADQLISVFPDSGYDLVILDISIHGDRSAGHKLCETLKALYPQIPIAMLTSLDDEKNRTTAMNNGANAYWTKSACVTGFLNDVKKLLTIKVD